MQELNEYYEENICPNCSKYRNLNCNKKIINEEKSDIKIVVCKYYSKLKDYKEDYEFESIYTLPKKYYLKNFKEI